MKKPVKTIPISYIRGLIVAQDGKCAISGRQLNPHEVNADHIVPLSREELSPSLNEDNIWLVHKIVNTMKCTLTYDELIQTCQLILENQSESQDLINKIRKGRIKSISKTDFDAWAKEH